MRFGTVFVNIIKRAKTHKIPNHTCEENITDLNEHKLLHGLHPLQQHDTRLEGSTQVFMASIRVTDCQETTHTVMDWDGVVLLGIYSEKSLNLLV